MERIKNMFRTIDGRYLFKSYFFAVLILVLIFVSSGGEEPTSLYIYFILCGLFFPFSTIVWDELIATISGGTLLVLPLPLMIFWKALKIGLLFVFTPLIAPIGLIYIYIVSKKQR